MEVKEFLSKHQEDMIKDLSLLVKHNSINSADEPPFGKANRAVLVEALGIMQDKGLKTNNLDYYCGYGEVGEGEKLIGILCHLDIVPAGDGWKSDPFTLDRRDEVLYGRGVSDDKGAAIAALYALKYLIDSGYHFKNRVRLILGCNEESGSRCIEHYVSKEGSVDLGFTPDAEFPGIFAEKGIIGGEVKALSSRIVDISGGEVSNVVMKKVTVKLTKGSYDEAALNEFFRDHDIEYNIIKEDDYIILNVFGKAAHASTPDLGINAFNYLMEGLYQASFDDELVTYFHDKIGLDNHGKKIGLDKFNDEYSDSTFNIGVVRKDEGKVTFSVDIRFPVMADIEEGKAYLLDKLNLGNNHFTITSCAKALFFDPDSKLPKALKKAYEDVTGDHETKMMAIGGGTYAKAMDNVIAFGCEFLGHDGHIHDVDECLSIEDLLKQVEIYIAAIKNLDEVA